MKYIMINHYHPIIFAEEMPPYCFQRGNESIRRSNYFCWVCDDQNKKVEIYGKSESLKMGPKESDQIAIEVFLSGYTELDLINIMALFALKEIPR